MLRLIVYRTLVIFIRKFIQFISVKGKFAILFSGSSSTVLLPTQSVLS